MATESKAVALPSHLRSTGAALLAPQPGGQRKLYATATVPATDLAAIGRPFGCSGRPTSGSISGAGGGPDRLGLVRLRPRRPERGSRLRGGHAICSPGRYTEDNLPLITWGAEMAVSNRFVSTYFDEVHAPLIGDDRGHRKCPDGFNLPLLQEDLRSMGRLRSPERLTQKQQLPWLGAG